MHERLAFASQGDAILLMGDAVLAMQSPLSLASFVAKCKAANIRLFALQPDCSYRGIESHYQAIELIDYRRFVELVTEYAKQVAW